MPSSACKKSALRSEEHTSELQSHDNLVCRLLLEKKYIHHHPIISMPIRQACLTAPATEVHARRGAVGGAALRGQKGGAPWEVFSFFFFLMDGAPRDFLLFPPRPVFEI